MKKNGTEWNEIERNFRDQVLSPLKVFLDIFIGQSQYGPFIYNAVLWFLPCLLVTQIVFYFINKKTSNKKSISVILFISIIIGYFIGRYLSFRLPWQIDTMFIALPFYGFGHLLKGKLDFNPQKIKYKSLIIVILFILITLFSLYAYKGGGIYDLKIRPYLPYYIFGIIGTIMVYFISLKIDNKYLAWLGDNSLAIMCLHEPIKRVLIIIISEIANVSDTIVRTNVIYILITLAIVTGVTVLFTVVINKYLYFLLGKKNKARLIKK